MIYFTTQPLFIIASASAAIAVIFGWLIFNLYRRWSALFGSGANTSSDAVAEIMQRLLKAEKGIEGLGPRVETLERIGKIAVQKVGFLRFNPFEHTGGDQSFAIALLDQNNNGIIISSLYTRDGVRTYAKEVERGASKHSLSEEEKAVLAQAVEES